MAQENAENSTNSTSRGLWTDNERINAGNLAAQTLNNPLFQVTFDLLSNKYYQQWLLSEDKEFKTRESCWYKRIALSEMMTDMRDMVIEAQEIVAKQHAQNDPEIKHAEKMDEQGFNLNYGQER